MYWIYPRRSSTDILTYDGDRRCYQIQQKETCDRVAKELEDLAYHRGRFTAGGKRYLKRCTDYKTT